MPDNELLVDVVVRNLGDLVEVGNQTQRQEAYTKRVSAAMDEFLTKNDVVLNARQRDAAVEAALESQRAQYRQSQQDAVQKWGRMQETAYQENAKRTQDLGRVQELAYRENAARIERDLAQQLAADRAKEASQMRLLGRLAQFTGMGGVSSTITSGARVAGAAEGAAGAGGIGVAGAGLAGMGAALLGTTAVLVGAIAVMASWAKAQGDAARETVNLSEKTGLSLAQTQLFVKASELAGTNANSLTAAVSFLSKGLADGGEEGKKQASALKAYGIEYEDALHRILPVQQILEKIGATFKELGAGPERDLLARNLFGRGGVELIGTLSRIAELEDKVKQSGTILSDAGIRANQAYAESWDLLWQRITRVKNTLVGPWVDMLLQLTGGAPKPAVAPTTGNSGMVAIDPTTGRPVVMPGQSAQFGTANLFGDRETIKNNLAYEAFKDRRDGSKRDVQAELSDARRELSALPKPIQGNQAPGDNDKRIAAIALGERRVKALQGELDAIAANTKAAAKLAQERARLAAKLEQERERVAEVVKRAGEAEAKAIEGTRTPEARYAGGVRSLDIQLKDDLRKNSADPDSAAQLTGAADAQKRALFYIEQERLSKERAALEEQKHRLDESFAERDDKQFTQAKPLAKVYPGTGLDSRAPKAPEGYITGEQVTKNVHDAELVQEKVIELQAGPNGELLAAQKLAALRIAAAGTEYTLRARLIVLDKDGLEEAKLRGKKEEEIGKAQIELTERLIELRKQQLVGDRAAAGNVFDSLIQGGSGVRSLATGFGLQQGKTIFQNATSGLMGQARNSLAGAFGDESSGIGKLLKGTVFGADQKDVVTKNITALDLNTAAIVADIKSRGGDVSGVPGLAGVASGAAGPGGASVFGAISSAAGLGTVLKAIGIGGGASGSAPVVMPDTSGAVTSSIFNDAAPAPSGGSATRTLSRINFGGGRSAYNTLTTPAGESVSTGDGSATVNTTGARVGAGVAIAGAAYGAYQGISSGIKEGGVRGVASGVAGAAGLAAMFDPTGISAGVALAAGIVGGLMGDPKANRSAEITRHLKYNQFVAPVALNESIDSTGNYSDYDRSGNVRSSPFSGSPKVSQPYFDYRHNTIVPGTTDSSFGPPTTPAAPTPPSVVVNVSTMDSKSFLDHSENIAAAVAKDFQTSGIVLNAMRRANI